MHRIAGPIRVTPTSAAFREKARRYRQFLAEAEAWAIGWDRSIAGITDAAEKAARADDAEALGQAVNLLARNSGAALSWLRQALAEGAELAALVEKTGPGFVKMKARDASLTANGRAGSPIGVAKRQQKGRRKAVQVLAEWERCSNGGQSRDAAAIVARLCNVSADHVRRIVRKSKIAT